MAEMQILHGAKICPADAHRIDNQSRGASLIYPRFGMQNGKS
jgi:hypothetical protein